MKIFLRNMAYISLGIILSLATVTILPQTIKSVTAQLSTSAIPPMGIIAAQASKSPKYSKTKATAIPFGLPLIQLQQNDGQPLQLDMNGDGLSDFIYSTNFYQYVILNNGSGFDLAYVCLRGNTYYPNSSLPKETYYQGDCADTDYPFIE